MLEKFDKFAEIVDDFEITEAELSPELEKLLEEQGVDIDSIRNIDEYLFVSKSPNLKPLCIPLIKSAFLRL